MSADLFSIPACRGLKSSYSSLSQQKKVKELSAQDEQRLEELTEEMKQIALTATSCDHGTMGDRWSFGILMEACKMKPYTWVVCQHKINQRSISIDQADQLQRIEERFPDTGYVI